MFVRFAAAVLLLSQLARAAADELSLKLESPEQTIHVGDFARFEVTVSNESKKPLTLVEPGDGSECKWRTPIIGWSAIAADDRVSKHPKEPPRDSRPRCGNVNSLKLDEVFTLQPGNSRKLAAWVGAPTFAMPGKYRLVFYYSNQPDLPMQGVLLGKHDDGVLEKIKQSHPCHLMSNEVIVDVSPKQ